jgi:hypothetical protein
MRIPVIDSYKDKYASAYLRNVDRRTVVDLYQQNKNAKYTQDCLTMEYSLYLLADKLNRPIAEDETVQYVDGNPANLDPANLEVVQGSLADWGTPPTTPRLENINSLPSTPGKLRPLGLKTDRRRA